MVAPVAVQQANTAAGNIIRAVGGKPPEEFEYRNPGSLATIGRNAAVVQLGRFHFRGFLGWLIWLTIHLMRLVGFRNRLMVLIDWAWDYFFLRSGGTGDDAGDGKRAGLWYARERRLLSRAIVAPGGASLFLG